MTKITLPDRDGHGQLAEKVSNDEFQASLQSDEEMLTSPLLAAAATATAYIPGVNNAWYGLYGQF